MRIRRELLFTVVTSFFLFLAYRVGRSFEVETHATISNLAVQASNLDRFLKDMLGADFPNAFVRDIFPNGINQVIAGRTVTRLIEEGSQNEDSPAFRSRHHFHDPTRTWDQAGLRQPFVGQSGESAAVWGQNRDQKLGGKHSWHDARDSYYKALTATDPAARMRFFAETFRSLGHLIHLVQDAAVPAHTRNDSHIGFFVGPGYGIPIGDPDRFHHWARTRGRGLIGGNRPFSASILGLSPNALAPVPIARIIDTEQYRARAVPSAGTDIGIAEYSHANFFSDDTILRSYPHPAASSLDMSREPGPNSPALRFYLRKNRGPGEVGYRAAVASRLSGFVPLGFSRQQWELDDNVMADYGALLFPRAIGYSAGLIDYFFRGQLEWATSDLFGHPELQPACEPVEKICVKVRNASGERTSGLGQITAFVKCCYLNGDWNSYLPRDLVSRPVLITLSEDFQEVSFTLTSVPPPLQGTNFYAGYLFLVYRGPLGEEPEAVVTGIGCQQYNQINFYTHFGASFFACER